MKRVRMLLLAAALATAGLAVAGIVFLVLAAMTSDARCTFDNFSCRSNDLLADAVRCLVGAVVVGGVTLVLGRYRGPNRT